MNIYHENQVVWPAGRQVTRFRKNGPFKTSMADACQRIEKEVGAFTPNGRNWRTKELWIFVDAEIGGRGKFLNNQRGLRDARAAVKFDLDGVEYQIAADRYFEPWQNLAGIAEYIKSVRAQERNGVFSAGEMMASFAALPPARKWFDGYADKAKRFRELAKVHHPDAGGDPSIMAEINAEYEQVKKTEVVAS